VHLNRDWTPRIIASTPAEDNRGSRLPRCQPRRRL